MVGGGGRLIMGGLIWYGACNGGPGFVRNVPNPARNNGDMNFSESNEKEDEYVHRAAFKKLESE